MISSITLSYQLVFQIQSIFMMRLLVTAYFMNVCRLLQCFQILMMISQMVYYHVFSYGYLPHTCMCIVRMFVFFMYGVSDVVKEGSRSHLLVRIYMMHHFLPLPI